MPYSDNDDFAYAALDVDDTKEMVIKHTTDRWETAKTLLQKLGYVLGVGLLVYVFWSIWGIYFWIAFFVSLPFTFMVARKLVRIPIRWFLQIDVKQPRFNIWGVPKSWSHNGHVLPATDNADNAVSVARTIEIKPHRRSIKTTMSSGDFDRLQFINDARTLDKVVADKERLTAYVHYLKRNFWNAVMTTLIDLQESSITKPLNEILRKSMVDLERPSVGKRSETKETVPQDED